MKKLLFAFLFVILGISLTTSGVLLFGGCSSSQTENGGGGTLPPQNEENLEKPNDDEDSNSDVVQLGYTATVSFNKNCSDTVTNMPSTASKSQQMVSIIVGASGWTISVTIGKSVPVRDGYSFKNWNTAANGTGTSYDPGDTVGVTSTSTSAKMASETLYAQWTQLPKPTSWTITVTYNSNTTDAVSNMPLKSTNTSSLISQSIEGYWSLSLTLRTNVPTRTGYKFLSWNTASNGTGLSYNPGDRISFGASSVYTSSASEVLYAQWEKLATPTVYFDATGGSSSFSEKTVTYSYTYGDLPTASRGGYSFDGWFTSSSGGSQVASSTTVSNTANHTIYAHWTKYVYKVDINILNPSGTQDYASGTMDIKFSYSSGSYTGRTDQPEDQVDYQGTITISNIKPTTGYYVSNVYCTSGNLSSNNGTYTYTATMTGVPSGSWDDAIVIQMAWKELPVNINILNPAGSEDTKSGTMDLRYSDGIVDIGVNNEHHTDGLTKRMHHGDTVTISNIKPAENYNLKSVTCDRGTLKDNGDGSYLYTVDFGDEADGTRGTITIQMTYLFYDEDEGYFYIEDGAYPQSYAAVEWDEYSGDGVYGGATITYNKTSNILTLDGTMTSGTGTILRTHGISFTSGQVYTVWREYIGGNISIQNNTGTSLVIDTIVKNSDDGPSTRNNNDAGVDSRGSSNLTINSASQNEADGFKFWIWLNTGTTVTFDNYQIRIYVCYDNLLPNWSLSNVGTMPNPMDTNNNLTVYSVNNAIADMPAGTKFVQVNNRWFKVEPIRWRVTDYATTLKVTTAGGWEIIGQSINVKTNTDYTLSLNYSTPSAGIPNFMVLSASPQNNNCSSISIASYQLSGNSKGEINLTFNSGSYSQVYVILNFGYVNDGTTYTFEFGNLRISDKSVEIEENISKWTKYQYSNAFSISETSAVASNGVMTNYTAVSDKVLTVGAVTSSLSSVDEGWSFMKSGNMISKITSNYTVSGNNISITYNASSQSFTLTNTSSSDPYATINHTVSLTKGVKYRMYMEVTNSSGASVGNNTVQVFYAINAGYSEAYSLRFGGSATWKEFTAPTTGVYKIRFDNDYGNTLIIKNFQIELVSDNGNQLVDGVDGAYDLFSSAFKYSRSDIVDIDLFGYSNQQIKIYTTTGTSEGLRVASVEEIEENLSEISAKASDMVCFLLDKNAEDKVNYWTRNLGSSLDNGQVVTSAGTIKSNWLNKQNGVRFAITMTVGS